MNPPNSAKPQASGQGAAPPSVWSYLRPHKRAAAIGVGLLLATNALDKSIPWMLQHAIDDLRGGAFASVRNYAIAVIAFAIVIAWVRTLSRMHLFNVGRDVEYQVRNELLVRIHQLGPSFFRRMATGDIMSRATNDLAQVRLLLGFGLLNVVNTAVAYVSGIGLMLVISPKLTLYALAPYPVFMLITLGFSQAIFSRSHAAQAALGKLAERAQENLSAVRIVRSFGLEAAEKARFALANEESVDKNMKLVLLRGLMWPVLMLMGSLGTLIAIFFGGQMVLAGEMTVGQFAAFNAYLGQLVWPTVALGFLLSVIQRGRASYARLREVLDAEPDVQEVAHPRPVDGPGEVRVEGLDYYQGDRKVLDGVSVEVPAGSSLAIVGPTGSGKSTLAALLPRLLSTPPRSVFVDGEDVTEVDLRGLRKAVGYAQQEPFLFSTTVGRNIGFSLDDPESPASMERVRAAAKEAAVLEDIEALPDGFDTVVGERGVQLSGGQKQRISLARALLNEPRVIVLDDPMSAVDAKTEALILQALDRAGEGRTLILVTHRVAAASRARDIIVLDEGKVVERGSHEALLKNGGLYARLAEKQRIEEELSRL